MYTGSINAHEEKTYHLKLWIDYDATVEQAANKTYTSKINVIANSETEVVDTLEATFTLDEELINKLRQLSKETYIPQAQIVELGIKEILKKYDKG